MIKFILFSSFILLILACNKEKKKPNTEEKPKITILSKSTPSVSEFLCGASFDNVLKLNVGDTLSITFQFEATNELSQYKLDAHNNFDCHLHGKSLSWTLLKTKDLNGKNVTITENIVIPEEAATGNYHFMIKLLDVKGHEAQPVEFNVILYNEADAESPVILLTSPSSDSISVVRGNELDIKAIISDNLPLEGGKYQISYTDFAGTIFNVLEVHFPVGSGLEYELENVFTIPVYAVPGIALFSIRAFDEVNNSTNKIIKVNILE